MHYPNGENIKDAVAYCRKACDTVGNLCGGLFYLNTDENGRFCGLANGSASDGVWYWLEPAKKDSQVCFVIEK